MAEGEELMGIWDNAYIMCPKHGDEHNVNELCPTCYQEAIEEAMEESRKGILDSIKEIGKHKINVFDPMHIINHKDAQPQCPILEKRKGISLDSIMIKVPLSSSAYDGDYIRTTYGDEAYARYTEDMIKRSRFYEKSVEEKPYDYDPDFDDP